MPLMEYFLENHDHFFYLLAGLCFVVELSVMGLSSPLLFVSIALFITAILINLGIISGWETELFTAGILTGLSAFLLWKPLKSFQNRGGGPDTSSDMIGREVVAASNISATEGKIRFSGIDWNARLADGSAEIAQGELCTITGVSGNVMVVSKKTN